MAISDDTRDSGGDATLPGPSAERARPASGTPNPFDTPPPAPPPPQGIDLAGVTQAHTPLDAGITDVSELPTVAREAYAVLAEHAHGGMGRVLRAVDKRLGRTVAVKELLVRTPAVEARFVREALVTARLQHPSIVPVHEAGRWPSGEPFYAMKLVSGRPLSELLAEATSFAERLAMLPIAIAVVEAMAYAHSRRVIHRDLKPANVVVGAFGEAVVIDWGLAKQLDAEQGLDEDAGAAAVPAPAGQTVAGSIVGTPAYMAPEQAAGADVDERADVYALGALLYTLCAGRPPYRGTTGDDVLRALAEGPPPRLADVQPGVPEDLLAIVDQAMARDPQRRYPTARELAADLKRFSTGQLVAAHHYSTWTLVRRFLKRNRAVASVVAAALVTIAVVGAVSVRRVMRERDRADHEMHEAMAQRAAAMDAHAREAARVDELMLSEAQNHVEHDAAGALAWLKRLRPSPVTEARARELAVLAASRFPSAALLVGATGELADVAYSPDGKWLAAGGADRLVHVWPTERGPAVTLPAGAKAGAVTRVAWSPDGALLAAADDAGAARLWDVTARAATELGTAHGAIEDLAWSPDGARVAVASRDGSVVLYDRAGAGRSLTARGAARRIAWSPRGDRIAARDAQGVVVWDAASGKRRELGGAWPGSGGIAWSPDGRSLVAGGPGGARVLDAGSGSARKLVEEGQVTAVAFAPDGAHVATCNQDGGVHTWELATAKPNQQSHVGPASVDVKYSPDGKWLIATRGPMVRVWDVATGELRKLRGHELEVTRVVMSPDERHLASASLDGVVRLWRMDLRALPPVPPAPAPLAPWLDAATDAVLDAHDRLTAAPNP